MKTKANSRDLLQRNLTLYVKRISDSLIILFPVQREVAGSYVVSTCFIKQQRSPKYELPSFVALNIDF